MNWRILKKTNRLNLIMAGMMAIASICQVSAQSCTPPTLSATTVATCESASNGSIDLTVTGSDSYTYLWSPSGATTQDISGIADGLHQVVVTVNGDPSCTVSGAYLVGENAEPFANAGLDKGQCENGNFTMTAVPTSIGTGTWSFVGPTNGASISEPNNPTTLITNLNVGSSATLAWTIVNINCSDQDEVTITNSTEVLADAGLNQEKCNEGDFIMSATPPSLGSGSWSIVGLPNGANIINSALHNTQVTGLNPGTSVTLRWVVNNGTCFDTDDVILTNNTPVSAVAGSNNTQCNNGTFQLQALDPFVGTGAWSIIGDTHGASIINNNSHDAMVSGLAAGQTITLRWRVTNGGCTASDDILLTNQLMVIADAGDDLKNCNNGVFTLAAEMPSVGSGSWSIIGPPGGAVVISPSSPTSQVVGLTNGSTVTLRWSVFNGTCFSMDQVTLFNDVEVFTLVGPNQVKCNHGTFDLIANTPTIGVGTWTFVSPPISATIDNINSPTAQVSGVQPGETASLRWTITNGGCSDYKELTLTNDQMVDADAGPDIYQCENGDFTMAANSPLATGAGFWEILGAPNGASIANPTDPSTAVNGLNIDRSATLKWTLTNGTCIDSDTIKIFHSAPVSSHAGSNQQKCTTGSFTLAANDPVIGVGAWSFIGEKYDAIISDVTAYNATVTGLLLTQQVTLRWTVTNGGCQEYEEVTLTNDPMVSADAGENIENCNDADFTLSAVDPTEGFGVWSIVGDTHGAIIDNVSSHNTHVSGLELGKTITLKWYVTNGGCEAEDLVTISNYQDVVATAGDDQAQCNDDSFTLSATPPSVGTGMWSIVGLSTGLTITDPILYNTTFSGLLAGQSATLRWTVTNGPCIQSDDVVLRNDQDVSADAGANQTQCDSGSFSLTGNNPTIGSGQWSIIGAAHGASISDINNHSTFVNNLVAGQSITLRWTITNGTCSDSDDVTITNTAPVAANAGSNQMQCANGDFTLAATAPTSGQGTWIFIGDPKGASLSNPTQPNATISSLDEGATITLRWTVINGSCSETDDIQLTNHQSVNADAGINQTQCNSGYFTLSADEPTIGTGTWTIIGDANGATISDITAHNTTVSNLTTGKSIILQWTITNGICSSGDTVILTNDSEVSAFAGPDQSQCNNGQFQLNATSPTTGIGEWSIIGDAHGASINDNINHQAVVTGLTIGKSVTLRWTVINSTCSKYDDIVLTNDQSYMAQAGSDQVQCNDSSFSLNGNVASPGSGTWTIVGAGHGAIITTPNLHNTTITGLSSDHSITLRWTITNGTCTSSDDVQLTNDLPIDAQAGPNERKCNDGSFTLAANQPTKGTGLWTIVGTANGATLVDPSLYNSTVTGLQVGKSVTLRWSITNGSCIQADDVTLTNDELSTALAGPNQTMCNQGNFTLAGNQPTTGSGLWTIVGDAGAVTIDTPSDYNTSIKNVAANQTVILKWTITNQSCSSSDEVSITNNAPVIAAAGEDQEQCNDGTFQLSGNNPSIGQGKWSIIGAAHGTTIDDITNYNTTISGLQKGRRVRLRWTVKNNLCELSDDVLMTNHEDVKADAGSMIVQCNNETFMLSADAPLIGNGTWTFVGDPRGAIITNSTEPSTSVTNLLSDESVTLRWTVTNGTCIDTDEVSLTNNLTTISCPDDKVIDPCQSQALIDDQFQLWIGAFQGITNASGTISYGVTIDDSPSVNLSSLTGITSPDSIGGKISIIFDVDCADEILTCTSTFEVGKPSDIESSAPDPINKTACSDTDDFDIWKDAFIAMGGCQSIITYDVNIINDLSSSDTIKLIGLTDLSEVNDPSSCGGKIEITIRIRSSFGFPTGQYDESKSSSSYTIQASTPITVYGPSDYETEEMASQRTIDSLFAIWIKEFGYEGGVCGALQEEDLSKYKSPSYNSGSTTVSYAAEDQCSSDTIESTFSVPPFALVPNEIKLQGPSIICANNDGYTYRVDTLEDIANLNLKWTYKGSGGVILEQVDNTIEMGFIATATEGYLVATAYNNFNSISDSIFIQLEDPRVCNTYCKGLLDISDFMINNETMPDSIDFWAEYSIFSTGQIQPTGDVSFNAGLSIELQEEFSVEQGGVLEVNIDHCDGIGIRHSDVIRK